MIEQILDYLNTNQFIINSKFTLFKINAELYDLVIGSTHYKHVELYDVKSIDLHFENNTAFITFFGDE